jgi:hypothetical protein
MILRILKEAMNNALLMEAERRIIEEKREVFRGAKVRNQALLSAAL